MNTSAGILNTCPHGIVHQPGLMACSICFPPTPRGWQCPLCQSVFAPHVLECPKCKRAQ